jgi:hypothetical protein
LLRPPRRDLAFPLLLEQLLMLEVEVELHAAKDNQT